MVESPLKRSLRFEEAFVCLCCVGWFLGRVDAREESLDDPVRLVVGVRRKSQSTPAEAAEKPADQVLGATPLHGTNDLPARLLDRADRGFREAEGPQATGEGTCRLVHSRGILTGPLPQFKGFPAALAPCRQVP